jgi:hypothetical protein
VGLIFKNRNSPRNRRWLPTKRGKPKKRKKIYITHAYDLELKAQRGEAQRLRAGREARRKAREAIEQEAGEEVAGEREAIVPESPDRAQSRHPGEQATQNETARRELITLDDGSVKVWQARTEPPKIGD